MASQPKPNSPKPAPAAGLSSMGQALERPVATIQSLRGGSAQGGHVPSQSERSLIDREFNALMQHLAPRIRHLTRSYGLTDMVDDAWQACAIAVHRAIDAYDPDKARFTTFVTWQMRGELQGLRHRVRLDQRQSARNAGVRTVSLTNANDQSGEALFEVVDDAAVPRAEAGASQRMAAQTFDHLWNNYAEEAAMQKAKPGTMTPADLIRYERTMQRERAILAEQLLATPQGENVERGSGSLTSEQRRQITRRLTRHMARQAGGIPHLRAMMPSVQ